MPGLSGFGGKVLRKETSKNTLFETVYSAQMEALNKCESLGDPEHRRLQLIRYNAQLSLHPLGYSNWTAVLVPVCKHGSGIGLVTSARTFVFTTTGDDLPTFSLLTLDLCAVDLLWRR